MILYFHGTGRPVMSFEEKYEILAELRNDGIKTFVAREKATGQAVEVHLFLAGRTAENGAILDKLQRLSPDHAQFLLETGDTGGTPYVVSQLLPDRRGLREWLSGISEGAPVFGGPTISDYEKGAPPPFRATSLERGETLPAFKAYNPSEAYDPRKGATLPSFQAFVPGPPPVQGAPPDRGGTLPPFRAMAQPPPKPAASGSEAQQTGTNGADEDFLRLFQVPERSKGGLSMSSAPATPPSAGKTREQGDFTLLFQSSPVPKAPGAGAAPVLKPSEIPTDEVPAVVAPLAPPPSAPVGEFTRMFNAQSVSAPPPPAAPEPTVAPAAQAAPDRKSVV